MKKMDEMEMSINLQAIKWSWLFTQIALFAWGVYDFIYAHIISLALYILIIQNIVYFLVSQVLKWKADDQRGRNALLWYIVGVVFFLLLFGILFRLFPN